MAVKETDAPPSFFFFPSGNKLVNVSVCAGAAKDNPSTDLWPAKWLAGSWRLARERRKLKRALLLRSCLFCGSVFPPPSVLCVFVCGQARVVEEKEEAVCAVDDVFSTQCCSHFCQEIIYE